MPRWKTTFVASWAAQICSIIGFSVTMPFIPFYVRELGVADERAVLLWSGWLASGGGLAMALVAPLWGVLADRYGRKLMVMRSMFGGVLVLALMGLAQNVSQLLILRIIQGMLTGTVAASVALVSSVVPERRAGFALGLMQNALMVGSCLGPWIGGHCAEHFGYRLPFFVSAGFLLIAGLLTLFLVHEEFDPQEAQASAEAGSLRQVLVLSGFATMIGLMFMVMFTGAFVNPFLPLYIEKVSGVSHGAAATITGNIFGLSGLAAAVSAAGLGPVSDRWGHGRLLLTCLFINGLVMFPHALARSANDMLALRVLAAFAGAGISPAANALIRSLIPRHACGKAFGIVQSVCNLGWGLGPIVGSVMAAQMGMRWPFVIVGTAFVIISVAAWRIITALQQAVNERHREADLAPAGPHLETPPEAVECPLPIEGPR